MTHPLWNDEYWLMMMQLYLKKPVGMKPLYSRQLVDLSLETHVPPRYLYNQMFRLRHSDSPLLHLLWDTYGKQPQKLADDVEKLKRMKGFGKSEKFYDGVEIKETFEKDFRPLPQNKQLKPVMLIMILDLYFRLTPITMSPETPEVRQLAKLLRITPQLVADVMDVFQFCDPYLNRDDMIINPLLLPCQEIWNRYGNDNPEALSALAAQLRDYFK